jgi:hypothetical protein
MSIDVYIYVLGTSSLLLLYSLHPASTSCPSNSVWRVSLHYHQATPDRPPSTCMPHYHHHHHHFGLDFIYEQKHVILAIWAWFISQNMILVASIFLKTAQFYSSYGWLLIHYINTPHFLYPCIGCYTPKLISKHGYHEQWCDKHGCAGVPLISWFMLL